MNIVRAAELLEECVFDAEACSNTFDAVADALNLRFFHLTNLSGPVPEHITGQRIHGALEEYQRDSVHERDIWTQAIMQLAPRDGALRFDRDLVAEAARQGDSYYQDYCPRHDVAFHGGWASTTGRGTVHIAIFRNAGQGDFTDEDRAALTRFVPAANRAARMLIELRRARSTGLAVGLEAAGRPSLLVDNNGRVSFVTPAAEALFDHEFGVRQGVLWAADPASNRRLSMVAPVAQGRIDDDLLPNILVRRGSRRPVILLLSPVRGLGLDLLPGARLIVSCIDLEDPKRLNANLLRDLFAMTPSEADVATQLVNGASVEQIAEARGLQENSVRQLIKAVLAKSDTRRQAEFVALVSKLPSLEADG